MVNTMESEKLPKLKKKQQNFVLRFFSNGKNASEAYRYAYDCEGMKSNAICVEASRLLKNPNVTLWLEYYEKNQAETIKNEINYTVQQAMNEADEYLMMALEGQGRYNEPNLGAAAKFFELKNKLAGNFEKDNQQQAMQINSMGSIVIDKNPLELNVGKETETETKE